jgi:hypothetical protein
MINISEEQLEVILDRAAKRGAKEALSELGLQDDQAQKDIHEMRSLLDAYRDTKKSIWTTFIKLATVAILSFVAASVWMQIGNK